MQIHFTQEEKEKFLTRNGFEIERVAYGGHDYNTYGKEIGEWEAFYKIAYLPNTRPDDPIIAIHELDAVFSKVFKEKLLML